MTSLNHATNNLDFAALINSTIDCSFDGVKPERCLVVTKEIFVIDSMAWGFCCFHKSNFRGFFVQRSFALISVQCPNSTAPNLDCGALKGIDGCENFVTWLCGFSGGRCGRDCWGRSTYVICCVAVHSPRRCCHLNSKSCSIRKDQGNFVQTSSALESDEPFSRDSSWARALLGRRRRDPLDTLMRS